LLESRTCHPSFWSAPPVVGADPQNACPVLTNRKHSIAGQSIFHRVIGELAVCNPAQAAEGADPDAAGSVLIDCVNDVVGEAVAGCEGGKPAVAVASQASALGSEPEISLAVFEQGLNVVVFDRLGVPLVENSKANAVEANESFLSGDPDISVAILNYGYDRVLGEVVVGLPDVVDVLSDLSCRVESRSRSGKYESRYESGADYL
jgi:hypothetical protein